MKLKIILFLSMTCLNVAFAMNATGPGGNLKTGQYYYGRDYGFLNVTDNCQMENANVATYNMNNTMNNPVLFQFTCPENTYKPTNGAFSPLNDAHYFGSLVVTMYQSWFNITPIPTKLKMLVHYGVDYGNTFWDGQQLIFGDGNTYFYPLVSVDVVAHEISHGFTEQFSKLYYSRQSGAINESFSDIAGEAAKYFFTQGKTKRNDWYFGGSIIKNGVAIRSLADPKSDGWSIDHASQYYDGLDVHYASGIFNKAFYLLATKPAWNTEKAFRAFVLANQIYWKPDSNFDDGACGVKKAANDLGFATQDVIDAFSVVGVDASCGPPPPPTCVRAAHTITLSPSSQTVAPGDETSFLVTLKNNDSSACGPSTFSVAIMTVNPYLRNTLNKSIFVINPGERDVTNLITTHSAAIMEGVYTIRVNANRDNNVATSFATLIIRRSL